MAMLLSFLSSSAYSFEVDGVYYNILQDKASVSVTYRNTSYDTYIGDVVIPESVTHDGISYIVTEIGDRAFYKSATVTSISIPPTLKKIGLYSFQDANHIKKVYITDLSAWCMMDFDSFYSSPLAYGGSLLLNGQTVSSLDELNASCTRIGKYAFYGNTTLQNVVIPDNIETIGACAFQGCSGMEYLEVGTNVVSMGEGAFKGCSKLKTIKFKDSPNTIKLGRYETNKIYRYFKDCPLTTVYTGRNIDWADDGYNYTSYYPFNTVKTAIFNIDNSNMASAFTALTDAYIGPNCHEFSIYKTQLTNLYVFNNDITRAYIDSHKANIYVLDKTNIPQKIADLESEQVFNLLEVDNLQSNQSYEYGSLPSLNTNQFRSNVETMSIRLDELTLNKNVGVYNQGLNITFYNSLWDVVVNVPFTYTITPAPLTVIANDATRIYGIENSELTCSFFGFKNNETAEVLTKQPNVETTATKDSPVGTYPIIATGAEAQNYSFNYERGTLTITKANQEIEWNQKFENIGVGSVVELTAVSSAGLPIKYSVTDETIAEVYSQNGKKYVEFLKPGTVSIRANQEGNENYNEADRVSKTVTVSSLVKEITLNQTSLNLKEGEVFQLTAVVTPADASNKILEWTSTNPGVASVDENGKIVALKQGSATISAKTTDGSNISANCVVKVIKTVAGISLNITSASLSEGQTIQLTATISPETADNKSLRWESSNENIAVVSDNGLVTAKSQGEATIMVKSTDGSNVTATCDIKVLKLVNSIALDRTSATLSEGENVQLNAIVSPEVADNKTLAWTSSNEAVATVNQNGLVTAVSQGSAIITVKSTDGSNISASCNITVVNPIVSIALSESELTMSAGETKVLSAIVSPDNATNPTLKWESTNTDVAKVENGIVVAVADGEADIVVSAANYPGIEAICHVTVRTLVTEIILDYTELTLKEGDSAQLTATVLPNDASDGTLTWRSTDPEIATVNDGFVLAHKKGKAQIFAEATDGSGVTAVCEVSVSEYSGIEDVNDSIVSVYVSNRTIHFANVAGLVCRVIQLNGSEIYYNNSNSEHKEFSPSTIGTYIVIVGSKSYKMMIHD